MNKAQKPPLELRLRVLAAIDYAPGDCIRDRIKHVANRSFTDTQQQREYRFKKRGITTLDNRRRADLGQPRKIAVAQLAEAIHTVLPSLAHNKQGHIPKSALYRRLLDGT